MLSICEVRRVGAGVFIKTKIKKNSVDRNYKGMG